MEKVIKNMVCPRCVESVEGIATELHLPVEQVAIGTIKFSRKLTDSECNDFSGRLKTKGFELITDRETEIANRVKTALIEYRKHLEESNSPQKVSEFLSQRLHYNYSYLSHIFAEKEGATIESFLIMLKIERVKELLSFNRFTLSEIAHILKYSSVQYLSNQFKKVTGHTVTEYRKMESGARLPIDEL